MCGQCGILSSVLTRAEINQFRLNLALNIYRGSHSTGVFSLHKHQEKKRARYRYRMDKQAEDAWTYLSTNNKTKDAIFKPEGARLLMGHCRHATVGNITAENAHPFQAGSIIGFHNGTIKRAFPGSKDTETDSEAFYRLINDVGLKKALEEVEDFDTAYALQYFDSNQGTLNFVRNAKRPLHLAWSASQSTLVWSSEAEDLKYAADKMNMTLKEVWQPKPYMLHAFHVTSNEPVKLVDVEDYTPPKKTYTYSSSGTYSNWPYNGCKRWSTELKGYELYHNGTWYPDRIPESAVTPWDAEEEEARAAESIASLHKNKVTPIKGNSHSSFVGYHGRSMTRAEFAELMMEGCANCTKQPLIDADPDLQYKIGWNDKDHFFCEECCADETVQRFMIRHVNHKPEDSPDI